MTSQHTTTSRYTKLMSPMMSELLTEEELFSQKIAAQETLEKELKHVQQTTKIYQEKDLEEARLEGYNHGFKEGFGLGRNQGETESLNSIDLKMQSILNDIENHLNIITVAEREFHENFFQNLLRISLIIVQQLVPYFYQKNGKEDLEILLHNTVKSLIVPMPIRIKVSKNLQAYLSNRLNNLLSEYSETIEIILEEEFVDNTCEITWAGGGAKWSLDSCYQQITEVIQMYFKRYDNQGG